MQPTQFQYSKELKTHYVTVQDNKNKYGLNVRIIYFSSGAYYRLVVGGQDFEDAYFGEGFWRVGKYVDFPDISETAEECPLEDFAIWFYLATNNTDNVERGYYVPDRLFYALKALGELGIRKNLPD